MRIKANLQNASRKLPQLTASSPTKRREVSMTRLEATLEELAPKLRVGAGLTTQEVGLKIGGAAATQGIGKITHNKEPNNRKITMKKLGEVQTGAKPTKKHTTEETMKRVLSKASMNGSNNNKSTLEGEMRSSLKGRAEQEGVDMVGVTGISTTNSTKKIIVSSMTLSTRTDSSSTTMISSDSTEDHKYYSSHN